jgi:hypothetical protein
LPQLFVTTPWSNLEVMDSAMELLLALLTRGARRGSALRPPLALTDPAVAAKLASRPDDFAIDPDDLGPGGKGLSPGVIKLACLWVLVHGAAGGTREWAKALHEVAQLARADGVVSYKVSRSHALCDDKDTA